MRQLQNCVGYLEASCVMDQHVIADFFLVGTQLCVTQKISLSSLAINHNAQTDIIVYGFNKEMLF